MSQVGSYSFAWLLQPCICCIDTVCHNCCTYPCPAAAECPARTTVKVPLVIMACNKRLTKPSKLRLVVHPPLPRLPFFLKGSGASSAVARSILSQWNIFMRSANPVAVSGLGCPYLQQYSYSFIFKHELEQNEIDRRRAQITCSKPIKTHKFTNSIRYSTVQCSTVAYSSKIASIDRVIKPSASFRM